MSISGVRVVTLDCWLTFHYAGIRRVSCCQPPCLSPLDLPASYHSSVSQGRTGDIEVKVRDPLQCQTAQRVVLKYINGILTTCFDDLVMAAKHLVLHHYVQVDSSDACSLHCHTFGTTSADDVDQQHLLQPKPSVSSIKSVDHSGNATVTYIAHGQKQTRCLCVHVSVCSVRLMKYTIE